jgi:teichuronic acid exporter
MELNTQVIRSTAWYVATRLWTQVLSWAVTLVLARLLSPKDYGLFAMSLAVVAFLELFQQFGFGVAIIQRPSMTKQQLNAIFWIVSTASLAVVVVAFLGAGLVATFYREPRLIWMVRILSLTFLLNSFGTVPYNLLTKEIDFKHRSLAEGFGVVTSAGVAIILAYLSYGVWALVLGHLARAAVRNASMSIFCGWIPGFEVSFSGMSGIMRFGLQIAGASGISTLSEVANTSIIGRFLGGSDLGFYSMAENLGKSNPLHNLSTAVINQLSLPIFSRLQEDAEHLRKYFLRITKYLAVISLPLQIGMALVARDLIYVLLSEKWLPIVGIFQIFSLGGVLYILPLPSAPVLTARGKSDTLLKFSGISAFVIIIAFLIGSQFGLNGVAVSWIIAFPILRLYLLSLALKELNLTKWGYVENISSPLMATVAMTVIVLLLEIAAPVPTGVLGRLILEVTVGAASYFMVLFLIDRKFSSEVKYITREVLSVSRS